MHPPSSPLTGAASWRTVRPSWVTALKSRTGAPRRKAWYTAGSRSSVTGAPVTDPS